MSRLKNEQDAEKDAARQRLLEAIDEALAGIPAHEGVKAVAAILLFDTGKGVQNALLLDGTTTPCHIAAALRRATRTLMACILNPDDPDAGRAGRSPEGDAAGPTVH